MARNLTPRCKMSRREAVDLGLLSGVRGIETKCKLEAAPGQHGAKRGKLSVYGMQLRAKQVLKRMYGLLERQFRAYYGKAARRKGSTGEVLLQMLECRLDNVVYRLGFAATRSEARQLVSHKSIVVNGRIVNIPSFQVAPGDVIELTEKGKAQLRVKAALEAAQQRTQSDWIEVDSAKMKGTFKRVPVRMDLPAEYNEQLVVELYSK